MKKMTKKKEIGIWILAIIAMIGCCLLLPILIVGGGLAFLGGYLQQKWLSFLGLAIIIIALFVFLYHKNA